MSRETEYALSAVRGGCCHLWIEQMMRSSAAGNRRGALGSARSGAMLAALADDQDAAADAVLRWAGGRQLTLI